MSQYFSELDAAQRYQSYRPKVHAVVTEWLQQHLPGRTFERAADVACGTGDSTRPLLDICREVIAIDSSEGMLQMARSCGIAAEKADYAELPRYGRFDLISTCMAFHWFDSERAIAAYKAASRPGAIWLIYNFGFAGHSSSEAFNRWFRDEYLERYPSPPRNRSKPNLGEDNEIRVVASQSGWLPVEFSLDSLVGYFSTQSNIEEAVRQGTPLEAIRAELLDQLSSIDIFGVFKYAYTYEIFEYVGR